MIVSLIAAVSENGVIGKNGGIPWRLPPDMKLFKQVTMGHHLVVGRKTFESIGKALPGRKMIVLTRQEGYQAEGCKVAASLPEALELAKAAGEDEVFIGGGAAVYDRALQIADRIYLSRVHAEVEGDAFFPECDWGAWKEELEHLYPKDVPGGNGQDFDFTYSILVPKKHNR